MSLDKAILQRYLCDGNPVFRIYYWGSPSFTYGVSQDPGMGLDLEKCRKDGIEFARRMTSGGILFHHQEITYSLVCNKEDVGEPQGVFVSYRQICAFLIRFYRSLGISAYFALEDKGFLGRSYPNTLCSASHEKYDIVIGSKKIGGNAQKRKREVIFQHGAIPISVNWDFVRRYALGLPPDISESVTTLSEVLPVLPQRPVLEQMLVDAFKKAFNVSFIESDESDYQASLVK